MSPVKTLPGPEDCALSSEFAGHGVSITLVLNAFRPRCLPINGAGWHPTPSYGLWYSMVKTCRPFGQDQRDRICVVAGFLGGILTNSGAGQVEDIKCGAAGSAPAQLTQVGGRSFLVADDGLTGPKLWVSDGSAGGAYLVHDIVTGAGSAGIASLTADCALPPELGNFVESTRVFRCDRGRVSFLSAASGD